MAARTPLMIVGAISAMIISYVVISTVIGPLIWVAIFAVLALVIVTMIKFTRRSAAVVTRGSRIRPELVQGIVDCAGENLKIGDTVRAVTGFDGPMELAFGRGVVVKVGRGKAHVRFNDIPEQVHPITPGTLRRLA
ncbi:MAG: hypothetical protein ACRDP6_39385 [Actinoallomurus sp.]